jgi:hypothetical protein
VLGRYRGITNASATDVEPESKLCVARCDRRQSPQADGDHPR